MGGGGVVIKGLKEKKVKMSSHVMVSQINGQSNKKDIFGNIFLVFQVGGAVSENQRYILFEGERNPFWGFLGCR